MARWLTLGLVALALCASCGTGQRATGPVTTPNTLKPSEGLPFPPLDPGHPAPPRATSAGDIQFDASNVFAFSNNGETGDNGDGTFGVLPGGEDDLDSAWVIFRVQLAADDRPVNIDMGAAPAVLPGGEDDLDSSYWLGAYSFSQAEWDWLTPPAGFADPARPGAWNALGTVPVGMNSDELRERYCNLGGEVYFCVLVEPKSRAGTWCGITIQPSTLDFANKVDAGYFKTEPLPATIANASGDAGTGEITLNLTEGEPGEPDRTYIDRRDGSGMSAAKRGSNVGWLRLGYVDSGVTSFTDTTPAPGTTYEYRAVAAVLDGNRALRAAPSNSGTASLGAGWVAVAIDQTHQCDYISLAVVAGRPAVSRTYFDAAQWHMAYQIADTTQGEDPAAWDNLAVIINAADSQGPVSQLGVVGGFPAIVYEDTLNASVRYAIAMTADGAVQADWVDDVRINNVGNGYLPSMAMVNACPAVAYYSAATQELLYVQCRSGDGRLQTDWDNGFHEVVDNTLDRCYPSLAVVGGFPAIGYFDADTSFGGLAYVRALDADGSVWGTPVFVSPPTGLGYRGITLQVIAGNPAMSYLDELGGVAVYKRANDTLGMNPAAWAQLAQFGPADFHDFSGGSLAVIGGNPGLAFVENANAEIVMATSDSPEGAAQGNWDSNGTGLGADLTSATHSGHVSLAEVDGHAAIAYIDQASSLPKYAILDPGPGA